MKFATIVLPLAAAALVAACDERPNAPGTDAPAKVASPSAGPAPVPSPAPPTTAVPVPSAPGNANPTDAATAKDSKANNPTGTLTKEEESSGMPKAGQANNHSSPSLEKNKP